MLASSLDSNHSITVSLPSFLCLSFPMQGRGNEDNHSPVSLTLCFGVSMSALCVTVLNCYRVFSTSEHPTDPLDGQGR